MIGSPGQDSHNHETFRDRVDIVVSVHLSSSRPEPCPLGGGRRICAALEDDFICGEAGHVGFCGRRSRAPERSEFRIGIARGRLLSGDWGVSFIRKNFDGQNPTTAEEGSGCQGGSQAPGGPVIVNCTTSNVVLTPDDLQISGVEVHKFIAFVTIRERVQIGLNVAGGIGVGQRGFTTETFEKKFTCRFAVGVFPDFSTDDPCAGGTRGSETVTPTGRGTEPFTRILNYERNRIPLGKLEIGGTVVLTPQLKVRISGGLNYPGMAAFGMTGVYFFGAE
jgi:hypothetical protein